MTRLHRGKAAMLGAVALLLPAAAQAQLGDAIRAVTDAIPGEYIVATTDSGNSGIADRLAGLVGGTVLHRYDTAFRGFALKADPTDILRLLGNPDVRYIEQAARMKLVQRAPWGLDRIDQPRLPLNGDYLPLVHGAEVSAYIIDTGIRASHDEFAGRLGRGANFAARNGGGGGGGGGGLGGVVGDVLEGVLGGGGGDEPEPGERPAWDDCNGHGTHVAGTVGGTRYGVANQVRLHAVRVLDCNGSGSSADVIAGLDWVAENFEMPAVANMSLGGGASRALDEAVGNATDRGIVVVAAAGNEDRDACDSSPARAAPAITVGASTIRDERASFSNYGRCVDILAPGTEIRSAWHTGDSASKELQGTSMAAPHVAGAVALLLGENAETPPDEIWRMLESMAVRGELDRLKGSPNLLLQVLAEDRSGKRIDGKVYR